MAPRNGIQGSVLKPVFELAGREFMCIEPPVKHEFTFTPLDFSLFVEFESRRTSQRKHSKKLAEDGK